MERRYIGKKHLTKGNKKIFLIDDSKEFTTLVSKILSKYPHLHINTFNDEYQALKDFMSIRPDLVILDQYLNMRRSIFKAVFDAPVMCFECLDSPPIRR